MILYDVKKLFWQVRCQYDDQENPPWVGDVQKVSPPPSRLAKSGH